MIVRDKINHLKQTFILWDFFFIILSLKNLKVNKLNNRRAGKRYIKKHAKPYKYVKRVYVSGKCWEIQMNFSLPAHWFLYIRWSPSHDIDFACKLYIHQFAKAWVYKKCPPTYARGFYIKACFTGDGFFVWWKLVYVSAWRARNVLLRIYVNGK